MQMLNLVWVMHIYMAKAALSIKLKPSSGTDKLLNKVSQMLNSIWVLHMVMVKELTLM